MSKLGKSFHTVMVSQDVCGYSEITLKFKLWKWKRKLGLVSLTQGALPQYRRQVYRHCT